MSDYYDIDAIIAENERIPCKFNGHIEGIGYLEESGKEDIKENTKLDLPVWLAGMLAGIPLRTEDDQEIRLVDLMQPDCFSRKVINGIKSDSASLSLRTILPNFYRLAEKWGFWFEDQEFIEMIQAMLRERSVVLNDYSINLSGSGTSKSDDIEKYIHGLDELEKELYTICLTLHKDMKKWFFE